MKRDRPACPAGVRAGSVALVGWTNVGKSTLLNRLVGDKLAAVAEVAQTTRHRITGVCNLAGRGQIVLVDTPGLHHPRFKMNRAMITQVHRTLRAVDLGLVVIDAERGPGEGDHRAAELLRRAEVERLAVLNKIDRVRPKSRLLPMMQTVVERWEIPEVLAVSARTGEGCGRLLERLLEGLPPGDPLFPEDYLTDQTERALAAEWIREKLLAVLRQELPHATAVLVESWCERDDGIVEIRASILVDKESQRQIVIGKDASLLKQIGTDARAELEQLLGKRVFLRLWVKFRKDWRNDERVLRELGLDSVGSSAGS